MQFWHDFLPETTVRMAAFLSLSAGSTTRAARILADALMERYVRLDPFTAPIDGERDTVIPRHELVEKQREDELHIERVTQLLERNPVAWNIARAIPVALGYQFDNDVIRIEALIS